MDPSGFIAGGVCFVSVVDVAEFSVVVTVGFAGVGLTTTGATATGVGAVCWQAVIPSAPITTAPPIRNR
jgi:hypothetical protein